MSIGRIFSRTFATIGANPLPMFSLAFVFIGLPGAVLNYGMQSFRYSQGISPTGQFTAASLVTTTGFSLVTIVLAVLAQGALIRATIASNDGAPVRFGDCAAIGLRKALPMIGLTLLIALMATVGLVLLIVPGIILYVVLSVAAPALVEENIGVFAALSRSAALTKGARWNVFAALFVALVLYWLISVVGGVALLAFGGVREAVAMNMGGGSIVFLLINLVTSTLLVTLFSALQSSLYIELRDWKDGPASEGLTQIFD